MYTGANAVSSPNSVCLLDADMQWYIDQLTCVISRLYGIKLRYSRHAWSHSIGYCLLVEKAMFVLITQIAI